MVLEKRPVSLNLLKIRLPLPGVVSILHRISGALLFLGLPLGLYGLQLSLSSAEGFAEVRSWFGSPLVKVVLLIVFWAYLQHFLSGLRHLALDLDIGVDRETARLTARLVLAVSALLTVLFAVWLW